MTEHEEQQLPTPNGSPHIHDLVSEDHQGRKRLGTERYGTPLQADNGRDALRDAYEESLDLSVYLRQAMEERNLQLEKLRERLENTVPDTVSTGNRKAVLDDLVQLIVPFVATPARPPEVRWHDGGETWLIEPGKTMQFPGGVGTFSLSFGEDRVNDSGPSPIAQAADAAWEAFTATIRRNVPEPDLELVHKALAGVDEIDLDLLLGMTEVLRTAIIQRKTDSVVAKLRQEHTPGGMISTIEIGEV